MQVEYNAEICPDKSFLLCLDLIDDLTNIVNSRTAPVLKWLTYKTAGRKLLSYTNPEYKSILGGRYKESFNFSLIAPGFYCTSEEKPEK